MRNSGIYTGLTSQRTVDPRDASQLADLPVLNVVGPVRRTGSVSIQKDGNRNFNRIQVDNPNDTPELKQLNQRLDSIYRDTYVKPMQSAMQEFKRTVGYGASAAGVTGALGWFSKTFLGGTRDLTKAGVAGSAAAIITGGAAGTKLQEQISDATSKYLKQVNNELFKYGYPNIPDLNRRRADAGGSSASFSTANLPQTPQSATSDKLQNSSAMTYTSIKSQPGSGGVSISSKAADFVKMGWVGNGQTGKQLIYGTDMRNGSVVVKTDAGKVLGTYAPGTTKAQLSDTMGNHASNLYMKGSDLPKLAGASNVDAQIIKQGWVGCEKTQKQLIMGWDGRTGQTVVMNDAGTVLGRYDQGVTKAQIADTMANPNSQLYMKGSDLRLSMSTVPVSLSAASTHNTLLGKTTELSAVIDPASNRVQILNNNQLVTELKPGASLDNARELIAMGTFNTKSLQAVKSIAALETATPDFAQTTPRLRMA
jgi:hypothetical protein